MKPSSSPNQPPSTLLTGLSSPVQSVAEKKLAKFTALLEMNNVDNEALCKLSWNGVAPEVRSQVWQMLLVRIVLLLFLLWGLSSHQLVLITQGYLPGNKERRVPMLAKKREEYQKFVSQFYNIDESLRSEQEATLLHQVRSSWLEHRSPLNATRPA
jgi:hypothetical protein